MTAPGSRRLRPGSGEAPFDLHELFFSRTDPRGVILAGNTVFQRVSDYPWDQLLGAPHKIIRHDDMPRGVYWLLWQSIQQGEPIGAFVKNRAQDGLHYWVFAILTPIQGGYLSVRLKPTSPLLETVEKHYATLRAQEKAETLDPQGSAKLLLAALQEHGFADYSAFMAEALRSEIAQRCDTLGQARCEKLEEFQKIRQAVSEVVRETRELGDVFASIRGIPYNMRILASQLEAAGGPISVISSNYRLLSEEIESWMREFVDDSTGAFNDIRKAVDSALFLQGTVLIQEEMTRQFSAETGLPEAIDVRGEIALLQDQTKTYLHHGIQGMKHVLVQAARFSQSIRDMKRLITGLGATRMMCKIEGARLRSGGDNLSGVIGQLDQFQTSIEERLARIDDSNRIIDRNARHLVETAEPAPTGDRSKTPRMAHG